MPNTTSRNRFGAISRRRPDYQPARLLVAALLILVLCNGAYAQNKQAALRTIGKFVGEVLTKLAVDLTKDEIKEWIKSAGSAPSTGSPPSAAAPNPGQPLPGNVPTGTLVRTTPAWVPQQKAQQQGFQVGLAWADPRDPRVGYVGHLQMWGAVGYFNLIRVFAGTPVAPVIQQAMVAAAAPNGRDIILSGYLPRIAGTTVAMPDYSPDAFRLTQDALGNWTISDTCSNGVCAAVQIIQSGVAMQ